MEGEKEKVRGGKEEVGGGVAREKEKGRKKRLHETRRTRRGKGGGG